MRVKQTQRKGHVLQCQHVPVFQKKGYFFQGKFVKFGKRGYFVHHVFTQIKKIYTPNSLSVSGEFSLVQFLKMSAFLKKGVDFLKMSVFS